MAEISRWWSGTVLGDSGPYSDDQASDMEASKIAPTIATQGVFRDQLNELVLTGAVSPVSINTGRAMVDGVWYENNTATNVFFGAPAGNPRIDRIVLRKSWAAQTVRITRLQGAEAGAPVPIALTQNDGVTWDTPLWQIWIAVGGATSIYADERAFIGQYEPLGISDTKVYIEEDFFTPSLALVDGNFLGPFRVTESSGNVAVRGESGLAGFGTGAIALVHTAGGAGGDGARIESVQYKPDLMNARLTIRAKVPNTDGNIDKVMGFVATGGTLTPTNGVYWRADGAANWFAVCRAGGVETPVDTGQAQDNTWRDFEIRQWETDVAEFFIDGVLVATIDTNIPSDVDLDLNIDMFDNGAVPGANLPYLHVDYLTLRGDR